MSDYFQTEVLPLFEENHSDYLQMAREAAINIALKDPRRLCTIDMVRAECPPPPDINPNVMGAVFRGEKGRWELVRYIKSCRTSSHGRRVGVYQLQAVTPRERMDTLLAESVGAA